MVDGPTHPCPFCDATGERFGDPCDACDGEAEISRFVEVVDPFPRKPHPVDGILSKIHHENRMRQIRELNLDEWVREQVA